LRGAEAEDGGKQGAKDTVEAAQSLGSSFPV
jgi:hypothetical protein